MRLGSYTCSVKPGSLAHAIYGSDTITERHRHRWEFNNKYLEAFEKAGMIASGKNPDSGLVEVIELPTHPFFIGVQYHPELKSTVENPQPIFVHFVKAAMAYSVVNPQDRKVEMANI
jgi:CTP synthase